MAGGGCGTTRPCRRGCRSVVYPGRRRVVAVLLRHGRREDPRQARASGIFRASLRLDGFVAAVAGYGGGAFTTPLLQFAGERLALNVDGGAGGWLRVEVLDAGGRAVQASEAVMGNGVHKEVSWRESIGKLAGTPVRLRVEMRDARLYALQFLR